MALTFILLNVMNWLNKLLLYGIRRKTEGNSLLKFLLKQNQQLLWQFYIQLNITEACETEIVTVEQSISDESHVVLALGLSQEDSECADSDFYSDPEFD